MANLSNWGNRLHSGETTYPIVAQRKRWFAVSAILVMFAGLVLIFQGLTLGIDFKGGTEYTLSNVGGQSVTIAKDVVTKEFPSEFPTAHSQNDGSILVQFGTIDSAQVEPLGVKLADAYKISVKDVSSNFIGPSWGKDVTGKAVKGLVVFLILVTLVMTAYFRAHGRRRSRGAAPRPDLYRGHLRAVGIRGHACVCHWFPHHPGLFLV